MYQSPIEIIQGQLMTEYENGILRAVQNYDIHCDKEELIKALMYDRNQYEKGYKDRDAEIIRCKECKWYKKYYGWNGKEYLVCAKEPSEPSREPNDFCSRAERRTE